MDLYFPFCYQQDKPQHIDLFSLFSRNNGGTTASLVPPLDPPMPWTNIDDDRKVKIIWKLIKPNRGKKNATSAKLFNDQIDLLSWSMVQKNASVEKPYILKQRPTSNWNPTLLVFISLNTATLFIFTKNNWTELKITEMNCLWEKEIKNWTEWK